MRYFGVLSSHCALRSEVVPKPPPDPTQTRPPPAPGDQLELLGSDEDDQPPARKRWAWVLQHVFRADLDSCPRCGGPMRWMEAATTPQQAQRLLAKLGLAPQPPPDPRPVPIGQLKLPFVK
jgi:hypothetical protein